MKRSLSDPHHPGVYPLLLRSGAIRFIRNAPRVPGDQRATGAAVLRHYHATVPAAQRRQDVETIRSLCPPGMSAYAIRMGRVHV